MHSGYLRVAAAVPRVTVADVEANVKAIEALVDELNAKDVEVALFPELCVTGYTCADLFHNALLLDKALWGLEQLMMKSRYMDMAFVVGAPVAVRDRVLNCAVFIERGRAVFKAKNMLPNYNEFYERRWFEPFGPDEEASVTIDHEEFPVVAAALIDTHGTTVGLEICEELWVPEPLSSKLALAGATVVLNPSASDDLVGKYDYIKRLVTGQSARAIAGYVYASAGYGESSTDLVFDGKGLIAENGYLLAEKERWDPAQQYVIADIDIMAVERDRLHFNTFTECERANRYSFPRYSYGFMDVDDYWPKPLLHPVDPHPFVPADDERRSARCTEIVNIQSAGLCRRLEAIGCRSLVVGISGGLDSTLALLVAVKAFDRLVLPRKGILGVTMPGFGTTSRTHDNAITLMKGLGVDMREISIVPAVRQHFADIGHDPEVHDVTYENSQARERTQLLMDIANQTGGIVLGTGDLSELALGWATYNGDHMSMYGVNAGVPKTLVRYLVDWFARRADSPEVASTLRDILDTPISPELIPADAQGRITQKTEDLVGPYELHDFFLYYMLRYGFPPRRVYRLAIEAFADRGYTPDVIRGWLRTFYRRFFTQQFKRSCMPDGPKVGSVALSPRGDWRMPSDASARLWLQEVDAL